MIQRLLFLILVIWAASTITFFIPRISPKNPIRERFNQLAMSGGFSPTDLEAIIASYNAKFGLDKPLLQQYLDYVSSIARFDLGVSLNKYPKTVMDLIMESLPWTIALLLVTTILSFVIGNLLGAVAAWPRSPSWLRMIATPFVLLMGVPPVIMGVLLLFFVAFRLKLLPLGNAYSTGMIPDWSSPAFIWDVLKHQILPGLALILGTVGGWVLSMRGMGVTIQGEDYVLFAEHKGLGGYTIFRDYYLRNAIAAAGDRFGTGIGHRGHLGHCGREPVWLAWSRQSAEPGDPIKRLSGDLRRCSVHHHRRGHADGIGRIILSVVGSSHSPGVMRPDDYSCHFST